MNTHLLSATDLEAIVLHKGLDSLLDALIERLEKGFHDFDPTRATVPTRAGISYRTPQLGLIEWMPAMVASGDASLKIVGYHPANPISKGLPSIISSICVFDTQTGHMKGFLDGTFLTALRTGAMSAIASKALAPQQSVAVGIVGAGAQAITQAHALSRVLEIEQILLFDTCRETADSFADRAAFLDAPASAVSSLDELLPEVDLLCTCTSEKPGKGPLFADFRNRPGLHINAVGSDFPGKIELPLDLLRRSFVCPDFRQQAIAEGECQQLTALEVGLDLSELLRNPSLAESKRSELTVFDSTGHAFSDYLTAGLFLEFGLQLGLGQQIEVECLPRDPKNPYSFLSGSTLQDNFHEQVTLSLERR